MNPMKHTLVLAALSLTSLAPSMFGQGFNGMVVFGTSLSDPGNHFIEFGTTALQPFAPIPDASDAIGGHHFTNGATWVEQLATSLHLPRSGSPALRKGGVFGNYAMGRARLRPCASVPAACPDGQYPFGVVEVGFEVNQFLSDVGGQAPPGYLYVIEVGGNDVNDALAALFTDPTFATSAAIIQAAVTAEAAHLQSLYLAGARTFLITSTPNFALTPYVRSLGPTAQFAAATLAAGYDPGAKFIGAHAPFGLARHPFSSTSISMPSWPRLRRNLPPTASPTQPTPASPSAVSAIRLARRPNGICFGMASTPPPLPTAWWPTERCRPCLTDAKTDYNNVHAPPSRRAPGHLHLRCSVRRLDTAFSEHRMIPIGDRRLSIDCDGEAGSVTVTFHSGGAFGRGNLRPQFRHEISARGGRAGIRRFGA